MNKQERLTIFIDGCNHKAFAGGKRCPTCHKLAPIYNRTFTTAEDANGLIDALNENCLEARFSSWLRDRWHNNGFCAIIHTLVGWLRLSPTEQCQVIYDFLESEEI